MGTIILSLMALLGVARSAAGVAVTVRVVDREAMPLPGIEISHLSVGPVGPAPRQLPLYSFAGVYVDSSDRTYEVKVVDDGKGLTVESSDGKVMAFSTRRGSVFTGSAGRVAFKVVGGRVTGWQLTPAVTMAKRFEERE